MSFSVDQLKNIPWIAGIVIGIIGFILFKFVWDLNWFLVIVLTLLVGSIFYLLANDLEQRKKIDEIVAYKEESVKQSIKNQRETDMSKSTCVSCNQPLKNKGKPCPNCGFELAKIAVDEN